MNRVAITGFGVVSPVGSGRESFFRAMAEGRPGIAPISRFDASPLEVRLAGEVKDMPRIPEHAAAAAEEDPKVGFAYAAFEEAMKAAGIRRLSGGTILHLGTSLEIFDLAKIVAGGKAGLAGVSRPRGAGRPFQIPLDTASRIIRGAFGEPAWAYTNCSACAAGAQAIGHGFREVREGRAEAAVCGGFDSMINPLGVGGFQLLGALTTDNQRGAHACRPFDEDRSGTVLGEGAACFVLEPLDKAEAAGKEILAEICGYGSSLDAHGLSAPDPGGDGAIRAMKAALEDAGIGPSAIGHINTHGTGTRLNDEIEAAAIRAVFPGFESIPVAATKSMTGHLIGAAGAVELGACLLPLVLGVLPPNISLDRIAQGCDLMHVTEPGRRFDGEYALSNSFGFGGQNAALILRRRDGG